MKTQREEGPTRNQTWGILKYLSAEFFAENQGSIRTRRRMNVGSTTRISDMLGQKLGYDNPEDHMLHQ